MTAFKTGNTGALMHIFGLVLTISFVMVFTSIFYYNKRTLQIKLNKIVVWSNCLIITAFLIISIYVSNNSLLTVKPGISSFFILFSTILLIMAIRRIRKDDNLIKSIDRIR